PTPTTELYTHSLHDALPIFLVEKGPRKRRVRHHGEARRRHGAHAVETSGERVHDAAATSGAPGERRPLEHGRHATGDVGKIESVDRKSTRLNSSHLVISYAV